MVVVCVGQDVKLAETVAHFVVSDGCWKDMRKGV